MDLKNWLNYLLDMLYPRNLNCVLCHEPLYTDHESHLCSVCLGSLQLNIGSVCRICGRMMPANDVYLICNNCKSLNRFIDAGTSVVTYDAYVKKMLFNFKYYNKKYIAHTLATMMLNKMVECDLAVDFDYIVPVPLHPKKLKKRGYNQAYLISYYLSEFTGLKIKDGLIRSKNTAALNHYDFNERQAILKGAFELKEGIEGNVLLVDDIYTTGHTMNHCAEVLKQSGATYVFAVSFAVGE